ncbi:MAG: peptidoglycan editing factor PgeF [Congregibacter sp.]|nr:peptidoglycan editing factor PgeF [Congregibacter sp.]
MSLQPLRIPDWPDTVKAFYTTRDGGCSCGPYDSLNLGLHVGDFESSVVQNRAQLVDQMPPGTRVAWLNQVHGTDVIDAADGLDVPLVADGAWTADCGVACAVMVADCLPVLLTDRLGSVVAAVHAGWRGLAAGVVDAAILRLKIAPADLLVWLGPAIGWDAFEVGPEVRTAFLKSQGQTAVDGCFRSSSARPGHYLADLSGLAQHRLRQLGVCHIQTLDACTFSDPDRFYSYRRDGQTGRIACLIFKTS